MSDSTVNQLYTKRGIPSYPAKLKKYTHKISSVSDVQDIYKLNILVQVLSKSIKKWGS